MCESEFWLVLVKCGDAVELTRLGWATLAALVAAVMMLFACGMGAGKEGYDDAVELLMPSLILTSLAAVAAFVVVALSEFVLAIAIPIAAAIVIYLSGVAISRWRAN